MSYERKNLSGKVAIVTGANIGLGLETARQLAEMSAKVYLACRNTDKAKIAADDIKNSTGNLNIEIIQLDLSKLSSVREFCSSFLSLEKTLDILINNAGLVMMEKIITEDGFENTLQCNYISHLLMTYLLLAALKNSSDARIVNVSSGAHKIGKFDLDNIHGAKESEKFRTSIFYATSKLYNIMATKALSKHLFKYNIIISSTHPGFVSSDIWKKDDQKALWYYPIVLPFITLVAYFTSRSPSYAAITSLYPAVDPSVTESGNYYDACRKVDLKDTFTESQCDALLEKSLRLLELDVDLI